MMTEQRVRRYGLAGLVGGVLFALYAIPDLVDPGRFSGTGPLAMVYGFSIVVPLALMAVGLVGLHAWLRERTGRLERVGYYLSLPGLALAVTFDAYGYLVTGGSFTLFGIPDGAFVGFVLSLLLAIVGSSLVGIAALRAGVRPRAGVGLLAASVLGIPLLVVLSGTAIGTPFVALTAPYGLAWAVLGYELRSGPTATERPATAAV